MGIKNKLSCLLVILLLALMPVTVLASEQTVPPVEAETDLAGLSWYVEDDCLYITGSGPMADYSSAAAAPWASYRSTATNIFMDEGITSIGNNAFSGFQKLTYVDVPDAVTRVGANAFANCPSLSSVSYCPTAASVIESEAFSGCSFLTYLELGGNLTRIGSKAFFGCTSLGMLALPEALTTVDSQAFEGCTGLKSLLVPASVTTLGSRAFYGCSGLTHIFFTGSAPALSADTFGSSGAGPTPHVSIPGNDPTWTYDVYNLLPYYILNHLEEDEIASGRCGDLFWYLDDRNYLVVYGEGEMEDYTSSTHVPWAVFADSIEVAYLHDGVTSVSPYAFYQCPNLTTARLPDTLYQIGSYAFYDCPELFWVVNSQMDQKLPDSVAYIDSCAFCGCYKLSDLSFSADLVAIGESAFFGCNFTALSLPDSLLFVDPMAFCCNYNLSSVAIPGGLLEIGDRAFGNCDSLSAVNFLGDAPKRIHSEAFSSTVGVPETTLVSYPEGNSTWTTENMVDYGRPLTWQAVAVNCLGAGICGDDLTWQLTKDGQLTITGTGDMYDFTAGIVIGDSEEPTPPWYALKDSITSVVVEEGVTSIGKSAFYKCFHMEQVSLPDSLTKISEDAFFDCDSVTCFDIGKNVTDIGYYAFHGSDSFQGIWVDPENAFYASDDRGVLFNKEKTLLIRAPGGIGGVYTIPYGVTEIYEAAFDYCAQLEGITIPSTVTTIRQFAFASCHSLTYVDIPESVTTIDRCAFWVCNHLAEIHFRGDAPVFGEDGVFTEVEAYVYYPEGNATWTEDKRQQYEGKLTWIPVEPETPGYCVPGLNNAKFYTIEEAMAAYDPETQYIKLLRNNSIYTWLEKDLRIDLNGFTLNGELDPEGFRIYGIDSATDSYTAESFGVFRCYDSYGQRVAPEQHLKTDKDIYGATKRYLAVEQENGWSFHRFYMGVSHSSFSPTGSGIGYKALFAGDKWVKSALDSQAGYGLELSLDGDFANSVCASFTRNSFPTNGTACSRTLLLKNILTTDMSLDEQLENGNRTVYVRTFLTLSDGTKICSGRIGLSMKLLLRAVSNRYDTYTEVQKLSLDSFRRAYPELCEEWNIFNKAS